MLVNGYRDAPASKKKTKEKENFNLHYGLGRRMRKDVIATSYSKETLLWFL